MTKIEALKWTAEMDLPTAAAEVAWFASCGWDEARDALLEVAGRAGWGGTAPQTSAARGRRSAPAPPTPSDPEGPAPAGPCPWPADGP